MPFLTAHRIHDGNGWLPEGKAIEVATDGTILSIEDCPHTEVTFYEGILIPGFVNAHCHLELSHMKGVVPEHTGLIHFLKNIPAHRNDFTAGQKRAARHVAYNELVANGIIAIGDIANTDDTIDLRGLDEMHFYTFIESMGFVEENAARSFEYALKTYETFASQPTKSKLLRQAIIPHAPYSVSASLFRLIDKHKEQVIISIHNQESEEENKYYTNKEGKVQDLLHTLGIDDSLFIPSGRSSLQTYLDWATTGHPFLLVHNTYTKREDVQYAHNRLNEVHWCLCPNANLYIEQRLPDIDMLINEAANICIGTDSLASNHQLCLLSELHTIKKSYLHISWDTLLTWATRNGAIALNVHDFAGTLAIGKRPGILQVINYEDAQNFAIKRII